MAKLQVYTSSDVINKISAIVNQRRSEGAKETEASLSSVSTMLLELGLRVYEAQMERKEDEFDQDVYNKVMLENLLKTQKAVSRLLGIASFAPYIKDMSDFEYHSMVDEIRESTKKEVGKFFPMVDGDDKIN